MSNNGEKKKKQKSSSCEYEWETFNKVGYFENG